MKSNQKRLKKTRFFIVFSYWKFSTSTSSFCFDISQIWLTLVPILAMSQNLKLCYSPIDYCHSWRGRQKKHFLFFALLKRWTVTGRKIHARYMVLMRGYKWV